MRFYSRPHPEGSASEYAVLLPSPPLLLMSLRQLRVLTPNSLSLAFDEPFLSVLLISPSNFVQHQFVVLAGAVRDVQEFRPQWHRLAAPGCLCLEALVSHISSSDASSACLYCNWKRRVPVAATSVIAS
ncbi:hypothetical protein Y032_0121g1003 [Ancylostoma ceylanicum]|uniref:Uncharacterized protein n=1 Tax=Ancylostoma ceylanicum TaxID=53326 RepID=A0A016TA66_9BILA|nr:hypothetical protein Y032_0121g1003 [Ancylostoma ceylanicum]